MEIKQYIKENEARFMEELFSLIRIPSISALPEHKDDMLACALRWKELLLAAGADEAMVMPSQGNPLVFAQKHVSNDAPTLLIYAHYDVMPAEPLDRFLHFRICQLIIAFLQQKFLVIILREVLLDG